LRALDIPGLSAPTWATMLLPVSGTPDGAILVVIGGKVMGEKMRPTRVVMALLVFVATTGAFAQSPDARAAIEAKAAAAYTAKNWADAESAFKQLVAMDPARLDDWQALANAQLNLGHYPDALVSADAAVALAQKSAQGPDAAKAKAALAVLLVTKGNIFLKQKKVPDAIAAYEKAAPLAPNPGIAYFNLCAVHYNTGNTKDAVAACDKAIAADPKKADAYFIKGSLLYADATMQNGKIVPSKDALAALRQYLVLAPDGPHVDDVKAMLDATK
jgi:tetratricopeptide (TPR) repeat protein